MQSYRARTLSANLRKSPFFTLPNNLSGENLVPELIQQELTPEAVIEAVESQFNESDEQKQYRINRFKDIHKELKQGASEKSAAAIHQLLEQR